MVDPPGVNSAVYSFYQSKRRASYSGNRHMDQALTEVTAAETACQAAGLPALLRLLPARVVVLLVVAGALDAP